MVLPVPGIRISFIDAEFGRFGIGDEAALQIKLACFTRRDGSVRRAARFLDGLVDGGGIGIESMAWWRDLFVVW